LQARRLVSWHAGASENFVNLGECDGWWREDGRNWKFGNCQMILQFQFMASRLSSLLAFKLSGFRVSRLSSFQASRLPSLWQ